MRPDDVRPDMRAMIFCLIISRIGNCTRRLQYSRYHDKVDSEHMLRTEFVVYKISLIMIYFIYGLQLT